MSLPESSQHFNDSSHYHDLIMQQLRLNDESNNRLESKVETLAQEVRGGNQAISLAHSTAITAIGDRITASQLNTETRLSTVETKLTALEAVKSDNRWWVSLVFSLLAAVGTLAALLRHP